MKRVRPFFVSLLVMLLFSLPSATSSATTCVGLPPLKPVHRICGVVFFPSGDRIANAKVTVLQAGKEIAAQETDNDGKFSFDHLEAGSYEIRVQVEAVPSSCNWSRSCPSPVEAQTRNSSQHDASRLFGFFLG